MWGSWITALSAAKFGVKLFHVAWPEMGMPRVQKHIAAVGYYIDLWLDQFLQKFV